MLAADGTEHTRRLRAGRIRPGLFGGNSNWRGPVWFPVNYLLIESLQKFHHYLGDDYRVECPTGSGVMMTLREVASELSRRLARLFLKDDGAAGRHRRYGNDPMATTWSCSMSIFMAKRAQAWAPAIRRAGRRWSPSCSSSRGNRFRADTRLLQAQSAGERRQRKREEGLLHPGTHLLVRNQAVKNREHLFAVVIHPLQILAEGGFEVAVLSSTYLPSAAGHRYPAGVLRCHVL